LAKIVTDLGFDQLFRAGSIDLFLEETWNGKRFECDGRFSDFSFLSFLAGSIVRKLPGEKVKASNVLNNNFKAKVYDQKYWFQYSF
jgi:hypothetical protein